MEANKFRGRKGVVTESFSIIGVCVPPDSTTMGFGANSLPPPRAKAAAKGCTGFSFLEAAAVAVGVDWIGAETTGVGVACVGVGTVWCAAGWADALARRRAAAQAGMGSSSSTGCSGTMPVGGGAGGGIESVVGEIVECGTGAGIGASVCVDADDGIDTGGGGGRFRRLAAQAGMGSFGSTCERLLFCECVDTIE